MHAASFVPCGTVRPLPADRRSLRVPPLLLRCRLRFPPDTRRAAPLLPSTAPAPRRSSGRRSHVRPSACFSRQRADRRVVARQQHLGHPRRRRHSPAACSADSRAARRRTSPAPPTPHRSARRARCRTIASISISAGNSPPDTTKSPIGDLLVDFALEQPLVDPFVAPRQQHVAPSRPPPPPAPPPAVRAAARPPATGGSSASRSHAVPRRCAARAAASACASGSRQHHHPRPAAVRPIVDGPVAVRREIARIPRPEPPQPALAAPARSRRTAPRARPSPGTA